GLAALTTAGGRQPTAPAIRDLSLWSFSDPRLAFNRTVVLRYRIHLEQRGYAPATINLRLAAVRRVAYEAADAGLLSPELAAGIRPRTGGRRGGGSLRGQLPTPPGRPTPDPGAPNSRRVSAASKGYGGSAFDSGTG